jgi:hypothetical protein
MISDVRLAGHHPGDVRGGQHVTLGGLAIRRKLQRVAVHEDAPAGHGGSGGHRLGTHVHHANSAAGIEMGEFARHGQRQ